MEPWYTSDLSLRYKCNILGRAKRQSRAHHAQCIIQAQVNNVLDQDYEVIVNYPMPGRNYAVTLSVEI